VAAPAGGSLVPETPQPAEPVGNNLPAQAGLLRVAALADGPAHIAASKVGDAEGTHGHAELLQRGVHLRRQRSLLDEEQRLLDIAREHAVADETVADARYHARLAQLL